MTKLELLKMIETYPDDVDINILADNDFYDICAVNYKVDLVENEAAITLEITL